MFSPFTLTIFFLAPHVTTRSQNHVLRFDVLGEVSLYRTLLCVVRYVRPSLSKKSFPVSRDFFFCNIICLN